MKYTFSMVGCEKKVVAELLRIFEDFSNFHCVSVSQNYEQAIEDVLREMPQLVFVDIDGGIPNPYYIIKDLNQYLEELPAFIALSGDKNSAYEVIKNNFSDYLLKSLLELELRKCLLKYQKKNKITEIEKVCLKSYSDYQFLDLKEILYLKADNNTTDFFLSQNRKVTAYKTLKYFEKLLPSNFLRVHHSYIVNTNKVTRINFGKSVIALKGNVSDIPFSKSYKFQVDDLKEFLYTSLSIVS